MSFKRSPSLFIRTNMERLRRSIRQSFRRRSSKDSLDDPAKPHQWQKDEAAVRAGTCSFSVKYLGCVEVYESRGMQVCEEALKVLRNNRRRTTRGVLYVSGDGLRVVDAENKGLIVDQTIEKVSFCAPDRNHEKGFAYICRDGTTRRWMCHGFLAIKDSGERLSHAVGCAFAVCLEQKQKRDREAQLAAQMQPTPVGAQAQAVPQAPALGDQTDVVPANYQGSFRRASLAERKQDPQNVIPSEKPPLKVASHPNAVARPAANRSLFERQGSLRMPSGGGVGDSSSKSSSAPFQRYSSLRLDHTPSSLVNRQQQDQQQNGVSAIWEGDEDLSAHLSYQFSRAVVSGTGIGTGIGGTVTASAAADSSRTSLLHASSFDQHTAAATARYSDYGSIAVGNGSTVPVSAVLPPAFSSASSSDHYISASVVFSQANGTSNKSRGEEWLQTAATQAKLLQQSQFNRETPPLSVVSVPSTSFSSSPIAGLQHQQQQHTSSATSSPRPVSSSATAAYTNPAESSHGTPDRVVMTSSSPFESTQLSQIGNFNKTATTTTTVEPFSSADIHHRRPDTGTSTVPANTAGVTGTGTTGLWHQSASCDTFSTTNINNTSAAASATSSTFAAPSFDDKWAQLESKRRHSAIGAGGPGTAPVPLRPPPSNIAAAPQQPSSSLNTNNPFTHESPAVKI